MKVILKENIKSIGKKDEIVNVSDGYARNYLFAKKLAVEANNENLSKLKAKKDSENYKKDIEKQEAKKVAEELEKIKLQFKVKQGENGKIFGGISSKEIAEKLQIPVRTVEDHIYKTLTELRKVLMFVILPVLFP